jgi:integrase
MSLHVIRRKDTGTLQITGTVAGVRVRRRTQTNDRRLAEEEANDLERRILRTIWHGETASAEAEDVRSFGEATLSYLKAAPRASGERRRVNRILEAIGRDIALSEINQERVDAIRDKVLKPNPSPSTVRRGIISPIRAIMMHAHRRGWCNRPYFEIPRQRAGRTVYLTPAEAKQLEAAAALHLKPLIVLLLCTGARLAEALELDWREVDLNGHRVTFRTKATRGEGRRRRVVELEPRAWFALACQFASNHDPLFAFNRDPCEVLGLGLSM